MKDYINLIFIAAIVGLIQFVFQRIGFIYLSDFSYLGFDMGYYDSKPESRIQSWFLEPSFLAYAFMPVIFLGVARIFNIINIISVKKSIIIILTAILSLSAIGILGILVSIIIVVLSKYSILHKPKILIVTGTLAIAIGIAFYNTPEIKFRVDDTIKLFYSDKITTKEVNSTNLSTYALYSNFRITKEVVKENLILGTGLGTYEKNYDRYLYKVIPESSYRKHYKINRKDANSLLLRITAELGLLGVFCVFYFFFIYRVKLKINKFNSFKLNLWAINNSILVLVLIRLLRQGHYTMLGFTLFTLIYYFTRKQIDEKNI
jgi:O-antigen ligase